MLTLAEVRQGITIPRVLALCCLFLAACTTETLLRPEAYSTAYNQDVRVECTNGYTYNLEAPWTMDEEGNISGEGSAVFSTRSKTTFKGTIRAKNIESIYLITDQVDPFVVYAAIGLAAVAVVFLMKAALGGIGKMG